MRPYLSLILTFALVLLVLIGLSAVGNVDLYRQDESESDPARSSYNSGPTGTRAFYQWLEESGYPVMRWRERFTELKYKANDSLLILIGPSAATEELEENEAVALQEWLEAGGRALVISRHPAEQLGDVGVVAQLPTDAPDESTSSDQPVDGQNDTLIVQPTELTRGLHGLALSDYATRLSFNVPTRAVSTEPESNQSKANEDSQPAAYTGKWSAPVVHLGDKSGAVLADFDYGDGRVVFLSDPYVISNHGLARGANLQLALNLINALGRDRKQIFFDEYHHGYRRDENALVRYFRGTPFWWVMGQLLLLGLLLVYSFGKRFARPLPLPRVDRHSPLEFVSSMANLQQAAQARDLAIENIYPRFKARLCRRLGLVAKATPQEIGSVLRQRAQFASRAAELEQTLAECEQVLATTKTDDRRLIELVTTIRRVTAELK
jgi:hypothetical protein